MFITHMYTFDLQGLESRNNVNVSIVTEGYNMADRSSTDT